MNIASMPAGAEQWPAYELVNQAMRVVVIPELGGKIIALEDARTGREWLWRNPYVKPRAPEMVEDVRDVYVRRFDSGGWDEIFPSVHPCSHVGGAWEGRDITDHGELWSRPWSAEICCGALVMRLDDPALPFGFERAMRLADNDGLLTLDYTLVNRGDQDLPYIWAAHPVIAIEPGMRIDLPPGTQATCTAGAGANPPPLNVPFTWPCVGDYNLSLIPQYGRAGYAIKLFTQAMADAWVTLAAPEESSSLRIAILADRPHCIGLWLNFHGWSGADTATYFNAGIEPTTTPADRLDLAAANRKAAILEPGATRRWALRLELLHGEDHIP